MIEARTPESVTIMEVIVVQCGRGAGTEESPFRIVRQFWSKGGDLLAEHDPVREPAPGGSER